MFKMNEEAKASFNAEDKEKHKKQQRLCNSLGSLLAGIDKGEVNVNTAPRKSDGIAPSKSVGNGAGPGLNVIGDGHGAGAGLNVTNDKGQLGMASTLGSGPSASGAKILQVDSWDALKCSKRRGNDELNAEWLQSEHEKLGSGPSTSGAKILQVDSWDALKGSERREEDELDADWLKSEHEKLDKLYGEGIVTVMYTDQNTIGYNCRLCFATMNAMKSLEMHCNGMKHLKKKGIYDKNKAAGAPSLFEIGKNTELPQYPEKGYNQSHYSRNQPDPYPGLGRNPFPRGRGEMGRMDSLSYPRDERDSFARDYRDSFAREYRDPYARDYIDPYARDPYAFARDQYSRDILERTDRHGPRSRSPSYADRYRESDSRPSAERSLGLNSPYGTMDSRNFLPDAPLRVSSPPPARLSPPPKRPALELPPGKAAINVGDSMADGQAAINIDPSLAGGPAAALLMKLSQCAIKNEKDAELASNIINLLLKSLKDYHQTLGEKNVADLMEQAEIKLGTAKAIRIIKKTTPSPQIDAVAIALETLRRANSDVPAFASLI